MAQRWIEAFIPLAISQRFLFDGEKLPDLNVSELNEEFREGLDDILGQQAIQQLNLSFKLDNEGNNKTNDS